MWFKNVRLYTFTEECNLTGESLEKQLNDMALRPCLNHEPLSVGWSSPLGPKSDLRVFESNGRLLICYGKDEKILPASVVREEVDEKVQAIEDAEGRKVGRKERMQIRDDVTSALMPRAFTRKTFTRGYIDPERGYLVVDAASDKKADEFQSFLRKTLGRLPITPARVKNAVDSTLTHWLQHNEWPPGFHPLNEVELRGDGEDSEQIVKIRSEDVPDSEELKPHLANGKKVTRMAIGFGDKLNAVLKSDLSLARIRYGDAVQEQREESEADDPMVQFDTDFTLMTLTFDEFLTALLPEFGGIAKNV